MASIIGVETLQHTNGTTAATIDSSGRINTPARPAFRAYRSTSGSETFTADSNVSASFNTTEFNIGSCFSTSTGKFTAPVAGVYCFSFSIINNSTTNGKRISLYNETKGKFLGVTQVDASTTASNTVTTELAANEVLYIRNQYADTIVYHDEEHSNFSGHLVG